MTQEQLNTPKRKLWEVANILRGTSIPACVMVHRKCREDVDNIIFIDAYRTRAETERYARPVSRKEIAKNDYKLNIPRYVDTSEPEEEIDLDEVIKELADIETELASSAKDIRAFCAELGIKPPC